MLVLFDIRGEALSRRHVMGRLCAVAALSVGALIPTAAPAFAQDRDCKDFSSQPDAQAALLPGDPERLDENDDGVACENYPYAASSPSTSSTTSKATPPVRGPETGDGSFPAADESGVNAPLLATIGVGVVGGLVLSWSNGDLRRRRRDDG